MEPRWNIVGQIIFQSGRKRYFRYASLDLNPLGASEIAKDKGFANFFMQDMGYPTIEGRAFFSDHWAKAIDSDQDIHAAYRYAQSLGFPVIVKPNSGSQGAGVALTHDKEAFYRAMKTVFERDRVALVQRPVKGRDYRVVVLDNQVISAYERIPLNVIGDGKSTIQDLLFRKQQSFVASSRDTQLDIQDSRIEEKLALSGMDMSSIPKDGKKVFLLDNANLSTGGDSVDVTNEIHPEFRRLAIQLTEDMGLRLCGVDLMIEDDITKAPGTYWVLEINAAPGLDHYVKTGESQQKIVENLYLQVLKSMEHQR